MKKIVFIVAAVSMAFFVAQQSDPDHANASVAKTKERIWNAKQSNNGQQIAIANQAINQVEK